MLTEHVECVCSRFQTHHLSASCRSLAADGLQSSEEKEEMSPYCGAGRQSRIFVTGLEQPGNKQK